MLQRTIRVLTKHQISVSAVFFLEHAAMLGEIATRVGIAYVGAIVVLTMVLMALN